VNTLGGYRLVRKLGAGSRAEVWLGSDGSYTAAIKVYRPEATQESIDAEIDALGRASSRHVVRLDDLASGPAGAPCLVLQRLSSMSLGRLLAERRPAPGEAVTILAPVAQALSELHRAGIAHGAVAPSAVLFDDVGAPVLAGFGSADLFGQYAADGSVSKPTPAVLAESESVLADVRGMISMSRYVLGKTNSEMARWLEGESLCAQPLLFFDEFMDRLFASARPAPVWWGSAAREKASDATTSRAPAWETAVSEPTVSEPAVWGTAQEVAHSPSSEPLVDSGSERGRSRVSGLLSLFHLPDEVTDTVRSFNAGIMNSAGPAALRDRVVAVVRTVRAPVWFLAGAVVVGIIAFALLMPSEDSQQVSAAAGASAPRPSPASSHVAEPESVSLRGDDPVLAGEALLSARAKCFDEESVLCLDGVDQFGSAAMEADSYRIRLQQSGGIADDALSPVAELASSSPQVRKLNIVESLGDTVLLTLATNQETSPQPLVTMLIVRGEDGWRIRDLVVSDPATP